MRKTLLLSVLGLAVALGWSSQALAQREHYGNRPYELNVNAGAHIFDDFLVGEDADTEFGFGGRIFLNMPSGWGFGGNFTWVPLSAAEDDSDLDDVLDLDMYLYSGEVEYTFGSSTQLHPFVGAGIGAATIKVSVDDDFDDELGDDDESETEILIPLAGGIKWFNRTNDPNWAIRGEIRDNIIVVSGDEDADIEGETTHNWEISGGISILFGGG